MIAGVLLASGASRRFGSNKLVALLHGRPIVRWSADALASAVDATYVVVPEDSIAVREALGDLPVRWVKNSAAHKGLASSIRAGIAALPSDVEAVVIVLGDQPLIDPKVIRRVVARWRVAPAATRAVVASYADGRGHPTLFGATLFPALLTLDGDRGARDLIAALGAGVETVEVQEPRPTDVDSPEALEALIRTVERRG